MNTHTLRTGWIVAFVAFAALWICADVQAAQVRAWLDRGSMQLGETVTLNVEVSDDASAAQPDFSVLQQDFNLLGTQSSTAMNIVNGQATSKLLWAVGLEPKKVGSFTIPALSVAGTQTQPLSLTVTPGSSPTGKAGDDVFLTASAEPLTPYVQQQARVTVKLFYAVNLTDGNLEDPHGEGLSARKLGQDASYSAEIDGRRYRVLERHYALTPEKSGAMIMAPVVFRGHAVNPNDINSFFNRGHSVTAQAPGATFDVRSRPAASGNDAWLPAQSISLSSDGFDANTVGHVGEPLTLTVHLKAQGLGFEQLPELKLPKIDGADIYPDKETTQNRDDGVWQFGERERKFAIVPNRSGILTIPPLSVSWWDTEHDRAASADLPSIPLNVGPAVAGATAPSVQIPANTTGAPSAKLDVSNGLPAALSLDTSSASDVRLWRTLALVALALWVLSCIAAVLWLRKQHSNAAPASTQVALESASANAARKAFIAASRRGDASASARALLAWARAQGSKARTLGELGATLSDDAQRSALSELERGLYAAGAAKGSGEALISAFRNGLVFGAGEHTDRTAPFAPLYPFNIRNDTQSKTLH